MFFPEVYFWVSKNVCSIKITSRRIYLINNMGQRLYSCAKRPLVNYNMYTQENIKEYTRISYFINYIHCSTTTKQMS